MSKRVAAFETHAFHASWESLKVKMQDIDVNTITDKTILEEFARLGKVVEYIDKYTKLIDPDINITNMASQLNNLQSYTDSTISHLNNFKTQKMIQHLDQANAYIDHCLTTIQSIQTILPKVSGQGIHSMLKKYNDTLADGLDQINLTKAIENSHEIEALKTRLLDGEGEEESIEVEIENMLTETREHHEELLNYYNEIFISDEDAMSTQEVISLAKEEIEKHLKETEKNTTELSNKIKKLSEFYVEIYGELAENGERTGGLRLELKKRIEMLDNFEKKQEKVHKETLKKKLNEITNYEKDVQLHNKNLFEQIKSLLPSATSAGLAAAYNEERGKFKKPIFWWNMIFIASLVTISIVSFLTLKDLNTVEDFSKSILHSLPISGPLIWLAIYASKRRSENQRLEQEYAHKEALAKSYSGYKQQIEGLNQENQELLMQLLNTAITAMSYNASNTLDKKHGDGTPIQEIAKSFMSELQKVIPKS